MATTAIAGFVLGRSSPIGRVQPVVFFFLSCYVLFGLLFVTNYFFSGVPVNSFHNKFKELMIKNKPFQCILFEHEGRGLKTRDSRYQCGLEPKRK